MLRRIREALKCQKGFTLVELMVVVAIIGILAAIAIPKFTDATQSAQIAKIQGDLSTIDSAIALHYANKASYPADVAALVTAGQLTVEPKDPAGNSYTVDTTTHRAEWKNHTSETDKDTLKADL